MTALMQRAAFVAATKANHRQHRIACLLVKGGSIISTGWNTGHIHGEHHALNRTWENGARGATAFVVRVRKDGTWGNAMPCGLCQERLKEAGISKVVYTNDVGEIHTLKLSSTAALKPNQIVYHFINPQLNHKPKIINRKPT